ncbi:MAG: PfkB family carbohydrate kinase, partial [Ramlibacter sp.]
MHPSRAVPTIATLTVNPAVDLSTQVDEVVPAHKLRCGPPLVHPGGGGVNVARVLSRLGCDVLACHTAGGAVGDRLCRLLDAEAVPRWAIPIAGDTRENLTVTERATGREYRFVLPGPALTEAEWQAC